MPCKYSLYLLMMYIPMLGTLVPPPNTLCQIAYTQCYPVANRLCKDLKDQKIIL